MNSQFWAGMFFGLCAGIGLMIGWYEIIILKNYVRLGK